MSGVLRYSGMRVTDSVNDNETTMKASKYFLCGAMAVMAIPCLGQKVTGPFEFGYADRPALSIPKEFSYNGVPSLMMYDSGDRNLLKVYDENLEEVRSITMKEDIPFRYQLTYQDEVRDVLAVIEVSKKQVCEYASYAEFVEREKDLNPSFSEADLVIVDLGGGVRRISFNYSEDKYGYNSNYNMYFGYASLGKKYPRVYLIDGGKEVKGYRVEYQAQYSAWRSAGTRVVDCEESQKRIRLCNINLNQGDGVTENYFEVSQTLFNKDAAFEYIMPKYKLGNSSGNVPSVSPDRENDVVTTRSIVISEQKEVILEGFQIVSENGDVVSDITFDNGFEGSLDLNEAFVITIGNNVYLAFDGYCNGEYATVFYKIDNKLNAVQKVKMAPSTMRVSPAVVRSGSSLNVSFADGNREGSDIVVASVSGAMVKRMRVPAGQSSVQIPAQAASGMYCVSRFVNGGKKETKKIIVK